MKANRWKYGYRGFSSKTFPTREAAMRDLVDRFPAAEPFADYLVTIDPSERVTRPRVTDAQDQEPERRSYSVRCELLPDGVVRQR